MAQDKPTTISPSPPDRLTLNFTKLLQDGLSQVQTLSHDTWTDYNEHDPGVTILEAMCYGLTDLAYRTDHPIEDILSSSAQVTGVRPDQQPLFPGDDILTNAPLTADDFRKLAYDAVLGLRNLWIQRLPESDGAPHGLFNVYVQAYSSGQAHSLANPDPLGGTGKLLHAVQELLNANRNLGQDFVKIEMIQSQEIALDVTLTIAPDQTVETVLAQMLYRIEAQMNPAPILRDVGVDLNAGIAPDEIFQGPRLSHGWIRDDSLAPLRVNLNQEAVLSVIDGTPGVSDVGPLTVCLVGVQDAKQGVAPGPLSATRLPGTPLLYVLSRRTADLERIKVFRNGQKLQPDMMHVRARWHHLEEQSRWNAGYATRNVAQLTYSAVPHGNPHRALGRYRSVQHLFPGTYGLGAQGAPMGIIPTYQRGLGTQASRSAARRQLKAYLLFFEQLLTNHLAQLENASLLLSFAPQEVTYHSQPLIDPKRPDPDAPPDIAPVLGEGAMPPADNGGQDWYTRYADGIATLSKDRDPVETRLARTLNAFLARFNDSFPDATLRRTRDLATGPAEDFERWLNAQKRDYLYRLVPITSRRGQALDLANPYEDVPAPNEAPTPKRAGHSRRLPARTEPGQTEPGQTAPAPPKTRNQLIAMEEAVRAKTGHMGVLCVVEHVLLRDFSLRNCIPNLEINNTFLIQPLEPIHAVRFELPHCRLHLLLDASVPGDGWPDLARRIAALGSDRRHYIASPPGSYRVQVQLRDSAGFGLRDSAGFGLHVLEEFASHRDAKTVIQQMVHLCQSIAKGATCMNEVICPATVPLGFFSSRTSVFLDDTCDCRASRETRNLVEIIVAQQTPAHLQHRCYWLDTHDLDRFKSLHAHWLGALNPLYRTVDPSETCKILATQAARPLRTMVQDYYVREILALRGKGNRDHDPGGGPSVVPEVRRS